MIELIGIIATLFVLAAFMLNDVKKIRIVDLIGAVLFVIYGILIHSLSVCILNFVLILIHIFKLIKHK